MVMSSLGIAATEHPLASQAAVMTLAAGGHAVDAAIAANAMMGVVAPMMNGVGGDLFAMVFDATTGRLHGLNASGWAPAHVTIGSSRLSNGRVARPPSGRIPLQPVRIFRAAELREWVRSSGIPI